MRSAFTHFVRQPYGFATLAMTVSTLNLIRRKLSGTKSLGLFGYSFSLISLCALHLSLHRKTPAYGLARLRFSMTVTVFKFSISCHCEECNDEAIQCLHIHQIIAWLMDCHVLTTFVLAMTFIDYCHTIIE